MWKADVELRRLQQHWQLSFDRWHLKIFTTDPTVDVSSFQWNKKARRTFV